MAQPNGIKNSRVIQLIQKDARPIGEAGGGGGGVPQEELGLKENPGEPDLAPGQSDDPRDQRGARHRGIAQDAHCAEHLPPVLPRDHPLLRSDEQPKVDQLFKQFV